MKRWVEILRVFSLLLALAMPATAHYPLLSEVLN